MVYIFYDLMYDKNINAQPINLQIIRGTFMIIHILQALRGDCIIVDFENGKCVLIDGGYKATFPKLKNKLMKLNNEGKILEYVILTHYDEDHISGLIKFFEENGEKGNEKIIPVDSVVCNQFTDLYNILPFTEHEFRGEISYRQQTTFEGLCQSKGWKLPPKDIISGDEIAGTDYLIKIISPSDEALKKCRKKEYNLEQNIITKRSISGWLFKDISDWEKIDTGAELTCVNKASLAFEIIFGEKTLLFCGDADMINYKELLLHKYNLIKLSHHGTYKGNESFCGNSPVIADKYIISTNGQRKEHPSRRLLAEIIMQPHFKKIISNYNLSKIYSEQYYLLYDSIQQNKYHFSTKTTQTIIC